MPKRKKNRRPKRPYGHFYKAYVYLRKNLPDGQVRLYLRDPLHRRVGYVDTEAATAALVKTGEMHQWGAGVLTHAWKRNNPQLYHTQPKPN